MNEIRETYQEALTVADQSAEESLGTDAESNCACPHRGLRVTLYSLFAIVLVGNVAARAAPELAGTVADVLKVSAMIDAVTGVKGCSAFEAGCCQETFVFEGTSGLPYSGCCESASGTEKSSSADGFAFDGPLDEVDKEAVTPDSDLTQPTSAIAIESSLPLESEEAAISDESQTKSGDAGMNAYRKLALDAIQ